MKRYDRCFPGDALSATERAEKAEAEVARLRKLCADRPSLAAAMKNRSGAVEALNLWIKAIDFEGERRVEE